MININIKNINQSFLNKYYEDIHFELEKSFKKVFKKYFILNKLIEEELKACMVFFNIKEFYLTKFEHGKRSYKVNVAISIDEESLNTKFYEFIIGKIDDINYYDNLFKSFNFNEKCESFIKEVMDYNYVIKDKSIWFKKLDLKVCPYCNRQYIFSYKVNNLQKEYVTYQLDHFYNKVDYYYLSLSFFNIVPSCNNCNLRKSKVTDEIVYPYKEKFGYNATFDFNIKDISIFYGNKDLSGLELYFDINENEVKEKIFNAVNVFNLQEVYNEHKDIVVELISKSLKYNKHYIDGLISEFNVDNSEEFLSKLFFEYSEDELLKIPFSKLHNDIVRLLKI